MLTYQRKEAVERSRHDKSEFGTWPPRNNIGICVLSVLTCCAVIAFLKDSCQVAQSLSAPSGFGLIGAARRLQWRSLQRQSTPLELRRSNKELLIALRDVFEQYQITYWLADGTLLGATRNGRMIPHDLDGDMSILQGGLERLRRIDSELPGGIVVPKNVKLQIMNSSRQDLDGMLLSGHVVSKRDAAIPLRAYSEDTGWYIDVGIMTVASTDDRYPMLRDHDAQFSHSPNQTFLQSFAWSSSYQNCMGCMVAQDTSSWFRGVAALRLPQDWILPTRRCIFEGEVFACPRNADAYLRYYYGSNFHNLGDPAPVCSRMADLSSLLSSLSQGSHAIGWKRADGSRWGSTVNSETVDGSPIETHASFISMAREGEASPHSLEHFEVTPVGHVMRKQAHKNHHVMGVTGDGIAHIELDVTDAER